MVHLVGLLPICLSYPTAEGVGFAVAIGCADHQEVDAAEGWAHCAVPPGCLRPVDERLDDSLNG